MNKIERAIYDCQSHIKNLEQDRLKRLWKVYLKLNK